MTCWFGQEAICSMDARQSFGEVSFFTKRFCKFWFVGSALPKVNSKTVFSKNDSHRAPKFGAKRRQYQQKKYTCNDLWH